MKGLASKRRHEDCQPDNAVVKMPEHAVVVEREDKSRGGGWVQRGQVEVCRVS